MPVPQNDLFRSLCIGPFNRQNLIDDAKQSVERRLDCIAAIDRHVTMQDFLKYFGIRHQALTFADQFFQ